MCNDVESKSDLCSAKLMSGILDNFIKQEMKAGSIRGLDNITLINP